MTASVKTESVNRFQLLFIFSNIISELIPLRKPCKLSHITDFYTAIHLIMRLDFALTSSGYR